MFPLSQRSLVILAAAGFLLAGAGWWSSWQKGRELEAMGRAAGGETSPASRTRKQGAAEEDPLLKDPRSVRLLKIMAELDEAAIPGEPNARFVKAVVMTLEDSSFHRRKRDFSILLDKMTKDDAVAIHNAFRELERAGRPFAEEYADFATRWGQIDGAGAMAFWTAREPFDIKPHDLHSVMAGWGSARPEEALAWIDDNQALLGPMKPYKPVVAGWLQKDPAAATAWLTGGNISREEIGDCLVGATLDKLYSDGIEGMSEWLAGLPDDNDDLAAAARQGWIANQYRFQNLDPEQAAAAWSQVGTEPWMGAQEFGEFCGAVARANRGDLGRFMEALSRNWPEKQITAQFARWTEQDPEMAGAVLSQAPPSDFRTAGIQGMIAKLEETNPARAAEWRERLQGSGAD